MEFEKYDPDKHDYFLDEFVQYSRKPDQKEADFFSELLSELVGEISEVMGYNPDFKLYFAMTDVSKIDEELPINRYVHGFSFAEWMEGFERDVVMIRAVKNKEDWDACLINMLSHEIAHQEFYSKKEKVPYKNWFNLVFEGHAMKRAEQVADELEIDWRPHYRSDDKLDLDAESIIGILDENRTHEAESIFQNGGKLCEDAEGYNLAYQVVKDIVDRTDLNLETLIQEDEEVLKMEVEESLRILLQ